MSKSKEQENGLPNVLMIGDSLTSYSFFLNSNKGLGQLMEQKFKGRAKVLNEGHPGYTTTLLLPIVTQLCLNTIVPTNPPLLTTLWVGTNDSAQLFIAHVPLDKYLSQMRSIITVILGRKAPRLVVITPPPVDAPPVPANQAEFLSEEEIWDRVFVQAAIAKMTYAAALVKLVKEMVENDGEMKGKLIVVDAWKAFVNKALQLNGQNTLPDDVEMTREVLRQYQCPGSGLPGTESFPNGWFTDRIHLATGGYEVINEAVFSAIDTEWPGLLETSEDELVI